MKRTRNHKAAAAVDDSSHNKSMNFTSTINVKINQDVQNGKHASKKVKKSSNPSDDNDKRSGSVHMFDSKFLVIFQDEDEGANVSHLFLDMFRNVQMQLGQQFMDNTKTAVAREKKKTKKVAETIDVLSNLDEDSAKKIGLKSPS